MKNIILEYEKHNPELTGNKAANLARLKAAGFAVPSFITILPSAFHADSTWQDPLLEDELKEAHSLFEVGSALMAVRSSALAEDGQTTSFAGQLDTFLNVTSEWVITAARSVWLSGTTERLKTYCKSMGISGISETFGNSQAGPAVVVQKMVDAKIAGVAFSADPVTRDRNTVVINAVNGLADRLVSGEVDGELVYVHHGRTITRPVSKDTEDSELTDAIVLEIAHIARKIETLFGCPQDIEWAHDGSQLFILQARPITTLPEERSQGNLRIWDNSNISESYQGVTTPLTFSFAAKAYEHVYIHFCRLMGVSKERIHANQEIFPRMLGFIRGRIYYNLVNWYRLLALLPGFQVNRPFMEQMMGVKEELPAEIVETVLSENKLPPAKAYWNFSKSLLAMIIRFVNIGREIARFQNHFNQTIKAVPKDLSKLNTDELAKLYRGLEGKLLSAWDAPLVNDFFAMIFFGLFDSLSKKWLPRDTFSHHELLVASGGIISAEPAKLIAAMADLAREDDELKALLNNGSVVQIEKHLVCSEKFALAFKNYLEKFGERCFNELKLESPTLNDNPLPLLRNIGAMAAVPGKFKVEKEETVTRPDPRSEIGKLPLLKKLVFTFVANQAIERIRWRENLRFERTRLFGLVRRIFLEFGKQFEQEGILHSAEDIFYLEVEEVLNFIEGKCTTAKLAELSFLRKGESQEFRNEAAPPNRIVTRETTFLTTVGSTSCVDRSEIAIDEDVRNANVPHSEGIPQSVGAAFLPPCVGEPPTRLINAGGPPALSGGRMQCAPTTESALYGLGCSPGIVRGIVRVVRDPASARPLENEILIAERTDPGWIVLFTQAKGIIVEYGSLLSHTAIVSRELGIPAIVSASGVMNWLRDGDLIEFDGKTGRIGLLEISTAGRDANASADTAQNSEHDPGCNVVKLIESNSLRREAS